MNPDRIDALLPIYRDGLLDDVLPFWIRHAVDREHGGFTFAVDRDGTVIDTDKGMWQQGRFTWLLGTLYSEVEPRDEWLALCKHGVDFIRAHGFDSDGRMFFHVTREGRPMRKRRYLFTELFAVAAFAAYARAADDESARDQAVALYRLVIHHLTTPGLIEPKFTDTRPMKSIGVPMILIATSQILRHVTDDAICDEWLERSIDEIERDFMKPDLEVVLEACGPAGEIVDHFDGRTLNPGHAIEAGWFILQEAKRSGDPRLVRIGTQILDWMWPRGWDEVHGGLLYFVDLRGGPVQEYWHDMKFWWPHNEAILATLIAHQVTGEPKYENWHRQVHDWTHARFPDPEHGEWFGYLHRDGSVSSRAKGNMWKGPFHIPRMQLVAWQVLEEMRG